MSPRIGPETQAMPCESLHRQLPAISVGLTLGVSSGPRITSSSPNALLMRFDPDTALLEAPHCLIQLWQCAQKVPQLSLNSGVNVRLPLHYQTHLTWPLYWVFIPWGGPNRMKGRLARCKWVPFDYLKAHLIKPDSLPAWGKLNEN